MALFLKAGKLRSEKPVVNQVRVSLSTALAMGVGGGVGGGGGIALFSIELVPKVVAIDCLQGFTWRLVSPLTGLLGITSLCKKLTVISTVFKTPNIRNSSTSF